MVIFTLKLLAAADVCVCFVYIRNILHFKFIYYTNLAPIYRFKSQIYFMETFLV